MLEMISEYKLELTSAPFAHVDDKVYFVASRFKQEMNFFVERNYVELCEIFEAHGLKFVFVEKPFGRDINGDDISPTLFSYKICKQTKRGIAFSAYHLDVGAWDSDEIMLYQFEKIAKIYSRRYAIDYKSESDIPEVVGMLIEMEKIARALKMKNVRTDVFDELIKSLEEPSKIVIGEYGLISFPDFGNVSIKLNPMEKTLYFFMLLNSNGVMADELVGYEKVLLRIYKLFTISSDENTIRNSIYNLLDESKGVLYSNVSRIRKKIEKKIGIKRAERYVIVMDRSDDRYKIALPDEYIEWDERLLQRIKRL